MEKWSKKAKVAIPDLDKDNLGGVYGCGSYLFVVVKPSKEHWLTIDTIIHEGVHVFDKAMEYVGEGVIGGELRAYHTAAIVVNLMKDFHAQREGS